MRKTTLPLVVVISTTLFGCTNMRDIEKPVFQEGLQSKIEQAKKETKPSFIIRAGDTVEQALRRLSNIDGTIYILTNAENSQIELTIPSQPITKWDDLAEYLGAIGYTAFLRSVDGGDVERLERGGYARVTVRKAEASMRVKATGERCKTSLSGTVPVGSVIADLCQAGSLSCNYGDAGAAAYDGAVYSMAFEGSCAEALEYIGKKADLSVVFTDQKVEFKMMDTAVIDLGIPLRDRKVAMDIIASSNSSGPISSGSTSGSATTGATPAGASISGGKSLTSGYTTNYFQSVRSVLDSMRTPYGTWNYVPETGQIFVRDRAEAVAAVKASLNRMAQAFQSRFAVTMTLYRLTLSHDVQINASLSKVLNQKLSMAFGPVTALTSPVGTLSYDATADRSDPGAVKNTIKVLSSIGNTEALDTFSLNLQAGIPQTLKVAKNTEYIRNVSTSSVTNGAVTSSVEQANATDGSFITVQARQAEAGRIAVDLGAFINRLDGFDVTQTQSSVVKSQKGFERTFDTMAVVEDGVPYVASIVSSKSRTDTQETIPGFEWAGFAGALLGGNRSDAKDDTYIVVVIEATRL